MDAGTSANGRGTDGWRSRPTLTVWSYDSPMGAAAGHVRLRELQRRGAVSVEDTVTVTWVRGTHRPRVGHLRAPRASTPVLPRGYSVLGALVDALLLSDADDPVAALADALDGTGVDRRILGELRAAVAPGWSVLLVLSNGADPATVRPAIQRGLARGDVAMTYAVLSDDAPIRLRVVLADIVVTTVRPDAPPSA